MRWRGTDHFEPFTSDFHVELRCLEVGHRVAFLVDGRHVHDAASLGCADESGCLPPRAFSGQADMQHGDNNDCDKCRCARHESSHEAGGLQRSTNPPGVLPIEISAAANNC